MNRSVERRRFAVSGTVCGEILIGRFAHPTRGLVRCPASPLMAATLRRAGHRVRESASTLVARQEVCDGVLFAASFLDRFGRPVGLAAAAHQSDTDGLVVASEIVTTWSALWRTRRVLVADSAPGCAGIERDRHLPEALQPARRRRLNAAEDFIDLDSATTVFLPSQGVLPASREAVAESVEASVIDATCPFVAKAHAAVRESASDGEQIVVIGRLAHAATPALLAQAPEHAVMIESGRDVATLNVADDNRLRYLIQPGMPVEEAMAIVSTLRTRFPRIRGTHPDDLCYAASDRLIALRAMAYSCDRLFLLGSPEAGLLRVLSGTPVHVVSDPIGLRPSWLAGTECVGIIPDSRATSATVRRWITVLAGLGPVSVIERQVTTTSRTPESMTDSAAPDPLPALSHHSEEPR